MRQALLFSLFLVFSIQGVYAQGDSDNELAVQYYQREEYEKAADLFKKLYSKSGQANIYYRYLYNSMLFSGQYEELEKILRKNIRKNQAQLSYYVDLGNLYHQQGMVNEGNAEYDRALKNLTTDQRQITQLANAFIGYNELGKAIEVYEKGSKLPGNPFLFSLEVAGLYEKNNNKKKAIENYLIYLEANPANIEGVKSYVQDAIQDNAYYEELKTQLLTNIQKNPNASWYTEMLIWQFMQRGNFKAALIQAKALDKRMKEAGQRVLRLAQTALNEKAYDAAIEGYQYIIDKGKTDPAFRNMHVYLKARQEILQAREQKITATYNYTREDLEALLSDFDELIDEYASKRELVNTIRQKARIMAFYMHDIDGAIAIMEDLLELPYLERSFKNECKLELGDYYLLNDEIWTATLLYGQVDKDMNDEPLGEMARYKNAKWSYYQGEFEWAQAQLDVLKASTSELIANDALNLSVFIMDNLGLDTTLYPMEMFAKADLLYYQNQLDKAEATMDSVTFLYPHHSLADDILYKKAEIELKKQHPEEAAKLFARVVEKYGDDLLGDDATFNLAQLYEFQLGDKEKAKQLYRDLIFKYKDSIYVVEARKRFRKLRGDEL